MPQRRFLAVVEVAEAVEVQLVQVIHECNGKGYDHWASQLTAAPN